jgi:metal-responsive CopG/Arc/MetJ family transcriptional regulator
MGKLKKLIALRIPEELEKALEEAQWVLRVKKTELIRKAIREYLQRHCPEVYEEFLNEQRQRDSET